GSFGASSGETLNVYMSRISGPLASNHGSSSIPLSKLMWRRLRSIEYGFETLASTGIYLRSEMQSFPHAPGIYYEIFSHSYSQSSMILVHRVLPCANKVSWLFSPPV